MLEFTVESDANEAFARKTTAIYDALFEKTNEAAAMLADGIREKLSGPVLKTVSGKALGSVHVLAAALDGDTITAYVEAGGPDAPYLVVQEYGGRAAYDILPVNKKALAFPGGAFNPETISFSKASALGEMVIVKRVHHPPLPERSFARTTVDEMRSEIVAMLEGAGGQDAQVGVL
jgi:hypothetical protein